MMLALLGPLSFDATEWDFGKVSSESGTLFHTFRVTNDSDEDFRISGIVCSCSCVNAYIGLTEIRAGETVDLKVSVNPGGYSGEVEHSLVLYGAEEKAVQLLSSCPWRPAQPATRPCMTILSAIRTFPSTRGSRIWSRFSR